MSNNSVKGVEELVTTVSFDELRHCFTDEQLQFVSRVTTESIDIVGLFGELLWLFSNACFCYGQYNSFQDDIIEMIDDTLAYSYEVPQLTDAMAGLCFDVLYVGLMDIYNSLYLFIDDIQDGYDYDKDDWIYEPYLELDTPIPKNIDFYHVPVRYIKIRNDR